MGRHKWTNEDDILAFYLYKFGETGTITLQSVAECIGFGDYVGSLKMRIKNFEAIDPEGGKGLSNPSCQSQEIFSEYKSIGEIALRKECLEIMRWRKRG